MLQIFYSVKCFPIANFLIPQPIPVLTIRWESSHRDDTNKWSQHWHWLWLKEIYEKIYAKWQNVCFVLYLNWTLWCSQFSTPLFSWRSSYKLADWEANSVILDQLFSHDCDSTHGKHCTWSDKNIFTGQQIRSKIESFQNANFLISLPNTTVWPLIGIVSERRFQWGSHHRVWLRNEKVIMKTILFTLS